MTAHQPSHPWWTLAAVCLGTFMLLLDVTIVIVALPDIQRSLGASSTDVQWVIDAYALSLAALLLTAGSLADLHGRRKVFIAGLAIFTVGSLLCGAAQSPTMLIVCRAVQGIGGAVMFSTSLALLAQSFQGAARGTAFGVWGAVTAMSTALGPVLGGILTTALSWRWVFFVNLPIAVVAIAITLRAVAESPRAESRRLDLPGFAVFTLALVGLVYGLIRAGERGWGEGGVLACLLGAAALLVAFPFVERAVRQPMFDLALLRKPTFVAGLIAAFAMNGSLFAMLLYLVLYLQNVLGYSALDTGLRLLLITGATLLTAIPTGRLSARVPVRFLIGPGLLLVGTGLLLMRGVTVGQSWTHLIPGFLVAGLGSGLVNPALASTAVGVVHPQAAGMASGINTTFRQIGIAASVATFGSILANHTAAGATDERVVFISGLNELFLVSGAIALIGGGLAFVLIRQRDFVAHGAPATAPQPPVAPTAVAASR